MDPVDDFVFADDHAESIEEESLPTIIEEEAPALDRDLYYARYLAWSIRLENHRVKNNVLQKIVIMYLRRRKVLIWEEQKQKFKSNQLRPGRKCVQRLRSPFGSAE